MNIRLGLLRLWIVLSLAWLGIFFSFGGYDLITSQITKTIPLPPKPINLKTFRESHHQFDKFSDYDLVVSLHEKFYQFLAFDEFKKMIGYESVPLPPLPAGAISLPPVPDLELSNLLDSIESEFRQNSEFQLPDRKARREGIVILMLPPFILLLCGISFFWVLSGFRRNSNL